jgi:hypothetical protein
VRLGVIADRNCVLEFSDLSMPFLRSVVYKLRSAILAMEFSGRKIQVLRSAILAIEVCFEFDKAPLFIM